jgi:hypothetical protein
VLYEVDPYVSILGCIVPLFHTIVPTLLELRPVLVYSEKIRVLLLCCDGHVPDETVAIELPLILTDEPTEKIIAVSRPLTACSTLQTVDITLRLTR